MTSAHMLLSMALLALSGCAVRSDLAVQPWRAEARPTHGVVRVKPLLLVSPAQQPVQLDTYLGAGIPWIREWIRGKRTQEIEAVPEAVGLALPAAINGVLGSRWDGTFKQGQLKAGERTALRSALRGNGDLDATLSSLSLPRGESALYMWIDAFDARPLTADGFPGEIVRTAYGPVVLDHLEEPYLIEANVGMALVAPDGEVVMRYAGQFTTVLSARRGARLAGRDLARGLAEEVEKLWAWDPRLELSAPSDPVRTASL